MPRSGTTDALAELPSWRDTAARAAITRFVERVTGPGGVPPAERVAVFDNDGTLWCEQPMPVQAVFLFRRLAEQAAADPSLVARQPWKAVVGNDRAWLGAAMTEHYEGDDGKLNEMAGGLLGATYLPMLGWAATGGPPGLALLVRHDDAEREFDYTAGADAALTEAAERGWTVVSVREDWSRVFAD